MAVDASQSAWCADDCRRDLDRFKRGSHKITQQGKSICRADCLVDTAQVLSAAHADHLGYFPISSVAPSLSRA